MRPLTETEIRERYSKILKRSKYLTQLNEYELQEVLEYAEKQKQEAIKLIIKIMTANPKQFINETIESWGINHVSGYQEAVKVIQLISKHLKQKTDPPKPQKKPLTHKIKPLGLKNQMNLKQNLILINKLVGFLFAGNTDTFLLYEFLTKENIRGLSGRIDLIHSNRLFVYLFNQMLNIGFIENKDYQSIIEKSNIFYSGKSKILKARDISTALWEINKYGNPKNFDIIDDILKRLKQVKE